VGGPGLPRAARRLHREVRVRHQHVLPGYLAPFKGSDGKIYGLPKDGNTIGMAYNTADVPTAPTSMDQLMTTAQGLKGKDGLKTPMCLNASLDRGLAFIYANGGSIVSDDGSQNLVNTPQTTAAVQAYLDLFKNGLGMTPATSATAGAATRSARATQRWPSRAAGSIRR
jgi:ABC-type glycerol-3-phosphate transport system substrate-binding protein